VVVIIALLVWVLEHSDELANAAQALAKAIWRAHLAVGAGVAYLVRDVPTRYLLPDELSDREVRQLIAFWLAAVPVFIAGTVVGGSALLAIKWPPLLLLLLVLPSAAAIIYGYYRYYFDQPVRHYRWPRFLAEYRLMLLETKLHWFVRRVKVRLWLEERGLGDVSR
jgi:hypothetical protein